MSFFSEIYYSGLAAERAFFDLRRGLPVLLRTDFSQAAPEFYLFADDTLAPNFRAEILSRQDAIEINGTKESGAPFYILDPEKNREIPEKIKQYAPSFLKLFKKAQLAPRFYLTAAFDPEMNKRSVSFIFDEILQILHNPVSVERITESPLPNHYFTDCKIYSYRSVPDLYEHYAVTVGDVSGCAPVDIRIHAECMTGDLLGSLRCDCGEQLHEAMKRFAEKKRGVLIYLRQEGRNIGLLNKMRAYSLQNTGSDTVDANLLLGFEADERDYSAAGLILKDLGVNAVIPHTDNPQKITALKNSGLRVEDRAALSIEPNAVNRAYLDTKYNKIGHLRADNDDTVVKKS